MNTLFETSKENYKDEWLTPPYIIKALGEFDLDPCSPVIRPWDTAKNHYTINNNGLTKEWFNRVWCNPPYSEVQHWLKKCAYHNNSIALTFARTDTEFFFKYVWNKAHSIFFVHKRICFYDVAGNKPKFKAGAPSVLIAYGSDNTDALASCTLNGRILLINPPSIIVVGISSSWISIVTLAYNQYSDKDLQPIYNMVERLASDKIEKNKHWKAKVRQKLQLLRKQKL